MVVGHVDLRSCHYNFCLASVKLQLVSLGIVADNVDGTLKATWSVTIIRVTYSCDAERAKRESEVGAVEGEETRINIHFKVSTGSHVSLPIAFVLHHLPA